MTGTDDLWARYCRYRIADRRLGFALDVSRMGFDERFLERMQPAISRGLHAMSALEAGAIANRDEGRMVGHYWLRDPTLTPSTEIRSAIVDAVDSVRSFAARVHDGTIQGSGGSFEAFLHIGIGGSALGPQLLADALGSASDRLSPRFIDNTDPDGIDRILRELGGKLGRTLVVVVSKSGGTPEPRNAMLEVAAAYAKAGLDFARHAVAVTGTGSKLDESAKREGWLARFPIWDWVGGRTSITSPVGLLPAALQGIDVDALLAGAAAMDRLTRVPEVLRNPAAMLALMWHHAGGGRGAKDMVVIPYKDRLVLLSRYLQQLVMESLGKERDRSGARVNQGIAVYGNKGSTDQHAYVQQLREGVPNFFVTFLQVLVDRAGEGIDVEPGTTSGDYLLGFLLGTREALHDNGRGSITLTIDAVTPESVGAVIALYERAVGLYAELIDVNAYHQPGVEAGKKAAAAVLDLQRAVVGYLGPAREPATAWEIAQAIRRPEAVEAVFKVLEHLAANPRSGVVMEPADAADDVRFRRG